MVNFTILAGGYTSFVASYLFNSDTNALTLLNQSPTRANPSWISLLPKENILYAINEDSPGSLQSFRIGDEGLLSPAVTTINVEGDIPAFTTPLSTGQVAIVNYGSGNALFVSTDDCDPAQFTTQYSLITFDAPVSNPHMVLEHGSEVYIPDLGADKIWRLAENGAPGNWTVHGQIDQPTGSGPRHIVTRGNTLYAVHQLSNTLTQQHIPPAPNGTTTSLIANLSIIPPELPEGAAMAGAEILIAERSKHFPEPFIYVSNRNTGVPDPRGDAIAIFRVEPHLSLVGFVYTGLQQVRGMQLGGPEKEFLIAGGVAGDAGVIMLKRTEGGRNLTLLARNTEIPTRASFVWLN
ncbi:putative isomerase YbhE [Cubamyces sp. BRFM 1775]|nr:putative isomerase YbhE [Cubamyces sp. BRFM 1775]